jgi:hypothetical protein
MQNLQLDSFTLYVSNRIGSVYSASSLKQQTANRHVAPLGHNILIRRNQYLLFLLNAACLAEKQQIPSSHVFDFVKV